MSFRFEEKTLFHISDYLKLKTFIFSSGSVELYPKRKISSLYFDNHENNMYLDSEDGCLPRKKIRITRRIRRIAIRNPSEDDKIVA